MIEFRNVTKVYQDDRGAALRGLTLTINKGDFAFLVGPSGAGKSTLIKLIFRELIPTSGSVLFWGRNIRTFREKELLQYRRQIGMIFQDFRLLKQKTVFENVAFALEVLGRPPAEIQRKVPAVLAKVGLADKGKAFPSQLSGGEQQRVGIARAIVKDPLLILADEPTGNVDRDNTLQLMDLLERINEGGTTVLIATHAWDIVDSMKKRVIALEKGLLARDEKRGTYSHER